MTDIIKIENAKTAAASACSCSDNQMMCIFSDMVKNILLELKLSIRVWEERRLK